MLSIFAKSFMTATRIDAPTIRDVPKANASKRRWLPAGHWWLQSKRDIDLCDL
ncbi:hypothetical protein [Ruegeria arenilitoris]|uniref:hypothetical protein n=1 Tax=Ruegeria arenilitoris TaxID=1173585 RepID=UPI00147E3ED6|nr:hypothetical protein [Ruegeria arenilitoris]